MSRRADRRAWDDWARVDPLWAILTDPDGTDERAFFESGREVVASFLAEAARLGYPAQRRRALDFGCGVGRLTQALAPHFSTTYGLDVSPQMIERAEVHARAAGVAGCRFAVHDRTDLGRFADGELDLVCSLLVLQHLPSAEAVTRYVAEFVRVLAPGGVAVFQAPTEIPGVPEGAPMRSGGWRQRLTGGLRRLGVSPRLLHRRLGWRPDMPMLAVSAATVGDAVVAAGGSVVSVEAMPPDHGGVRSSLYFVGGAAG